MTECPFLRPKVGYHSMDVIDDPTEDAVWSPKSKAKNVRHFSASWNESRPKSAALKDIDIADILGSAISMNIDDLQQICLLTI